MPKEAIISKQMRSPLTTCPVCHCWFEPFLRGQVARFSWWGLRRRIWAVICRSCKEIVDWESIP